MRSSDDDQHTTGGELAHIIDQISGQGGQEEVSTASAASAIIGADSEARSNRVETRPVTQIEDVTELSTGEVTVVHDGDEGTPQSESAVDIEEVVSTSRHGAVVPEVQCGGEGAVAAVSFVGAAGQLAEDVSIVEGAAGDAESHASTIADKQIAIEGQRADSCTSVITGHHCAERSDGVIRDIRRSLNRATASQNTTVHGRGTRAGAPGSRLAHLEHPGIHRGCASVLIQPTSDPRAFASFDQGDRGIRNDAAQAVGRSGRAAESECLGPDSGGGNIAFKYKNPGAGSLHTATARGANEIEHAICAFSRAGVAQDARSGALSQGDGAGRNAGGSTEAAAAGTRTDSIQRGCRQSALLNGNAAGEGAAGEDELVIGKIRRDGTANRDADARIDRRNSGACQKTRTRHHLADSDLGSAAHRDGGISQKSRASAADRGINVPQAGAGLQKGQRAGVVTQGTTEQVGVRVGTAQFEGLGTGARNAKTATEDQGTRAGRADETAAGGSSQIKHSIAGLPGALIDQTAGQGSAAQTDHGCRRINRSAEAGGSRGAGCVVQRKNRQ